MLKSVFPSDFRTKYLYILVLHARSILLLSVITLLISEDELNL